MNDRTAMVVTVVGTSVGMAALLLTVMTLLIGSVNTRIDDFRDAMNARIDDTNGRIDDTNARLDDTNGRIEDTNARIDDTNSRIDDLNDRMSGIQTGMRELRNLLIEALKVQGTQAPANEQ